MHEKNAAFKKFDQNKVHQISEQDVNERKAI